MIFPPTRRRWKPFLALPLLAVAGLAAAAPATAADFTWRHGPDGSLTVNTQTPPRAVNLWQATNPKARDFRLESLGPVWTSIAVEGKDGVYATNVARPAEGWTAYLMELTFDLGANLPLKLTTNVTVTPNTLPFPPYDAPKPRGFLTN